MGANVPFVEASTTGAAAGNLRPLGRGGCQWARKRCEWNLIEIELSPSGDRWIVLEAFQDLGTKISDFKEFVRAVDSGD